MRNEKDHKRLWALQGLDSHTRWIKDSSERVAYYATMLTSRPEYETEAESSLNEAEKTVADALKTIREIKKAFHRKSVEN